MSLHWAQDAPTLMREWQRALVVDGFLMFTTLGPGTLVTLRDLYRAHGWGTPYAPWTDMHDLGDMLVEAGFADPVMDQETLRLTWSTPAGRARRTAHAGHEHRRRPLRRPAHAALARPPARGARRAASIAQGRVVLEFEIVYGHAFKPVPRARLAAADPGGTRRHEGDAEPRPSTPLKRRAWGRAYAESRRHFFGMNRP